MDAWVADESLPDEVRIVSMAVDSKGMPAVVSDPKISYKNNVIWHK